MSESYEVGTRAWQPDALEGWVPSEVEKKLVEGDKLRLVFRLENGEVSILIHLGSWGEELAIWVRNHQGLSKSCLPVQILMDVLSSKNGCWNG